MTTAVKQLKDVPMTEQAATGTIPTMTEVYTRPADITGVIPARVAPGYEVSRCGDDQSLMAQAKADEFIIARYGMLAPNDPSRLLIANQDDFRVDKDDVLRWKGDVVVVRSATYGDGQRADRQQTAIRLQGGKVAPMDPEQAEEYLAGQHRELLEQDRFNG